MTSAFTAVAVETYRYAPFYESADCSGPAVAPIATLPRYTFTVVGETKYFAWPDVALSPKFIATKSTKDSVGTCAPSTGSDSMLPLPTLTPPIVKPALLFKPPAHPEF